MLPRRLAPHYLAAAFAVSAPQHGADNRAAPALLKLGSVWMKLTLYLCGNFHMLMCRLWRDCSAASLIEYCIAVGIITTLIMVGIALAGGWVQAMWAGLLTRLSG